MSKHVFVIKEKLSQSFWQLVKAFRFENKKIENVLTLLSRNSHMFAGYDMSILLRTHDDELNSMLLLDSGKDQKQQHAPNQSH